MKDFKNKVAVITGAARGIGRGLAKYCAQHEMKIVVADVEKALATAESALQSYGAEIITVVTDVSKIEDVQALARKATDAFGSVRSTIAIGLLA